MTLRTYLPSDQADAFWLGHTDGVDKDPHAADLAIPEVRDSYIEGYHYGFLDRKRREIGSKEDLGSSVFMANSRATVERIGLPWWANYTRGA